jgi:hypothetical protein
MVQLEEPSLGVANRRYVCKVRQVALYRGTRSTATKAPEAWVTLRNVTPRIWQLFSNRWKSTGV